MSKELATNFEDRLNTELRAAETMAQADMLPDRFKGKPANVLVAREIAQAMGESPWVTMSELYFVGNTPTFSAKYMRSRVRAAGHILREHFDPQTMTATCSIIRNDDPDYEHTVTWDKAKAQAHGLWDKGHWKKNPELMMKNRAVSECVRMACNEVMGGVDYTPEEAENMRPYKATATRKDAPGRGSAGLQAALAAPAPAEPEDAVLDDESVAVGEALAAIEAAESRPELKDVMATFTEDVLGDGYKQVHEAGSARWRDLAPEEEQ